MSASCLKQSICRTQGTICTGAVIPLPSQRNDFRRRPQVKQKRGWVMERISGFIPLLCSECKRRDLEGTCLTGYE